MKKHNCDYLLLFTLPYCRYNKKLKMSLARARLEYEKSDEFVKFGVTEFPTLILMGNKNGYKHEEIKRHTGFMTEDELNEFVKDTSCTRWIRKERPYYE